MDKAVKSALGVAANSILLGGMAFGPWGLAVGGVISGAMSFFTQVFGSTGDPTMADFLATTGGEISDAVDEIQQAITGNTTSLKLANVDSAQTWLAVNLGSTLKSSYDPTPADLQTLLGLIETQVGKPSRDAMSWCQNQIPKTDPAYASLAVYNVAATTLLNSYKFKLSVRRVYDGKQVLAGKVTKMTAPSQYPEYLDLVDYLGQIQTYLKTQVDAVNQAFVAANDDVFKVVKAPSVETQISVGQDRLAKRDTAVGTQILPLPPGVYDLAAIKLLNDTYAGFLSAVSDYQALKSIPK